MNHKNIVKVKHLIQVNNKMYMSMEHIGGGSLNEYLKSMEKKHEVISDIQASTIMKQIFEAVSFIHDKGLIHRDLKTANILLSSKAGEEPTVKIIDFGFGQRQQLESLYDHVGTLAYMAPEVAIHQEYTKSVDIWALGIIMHKFLTGNQHPLFVKKKDDVHSYRKKLAEIKKLEPSKEISWLSQNLFQRLTTVQAHQRFSAKDALKHPWITRNRLDKIPRSFGDEMKNLETEQTLKQKMQALLFMSVMLRK